ncbi:MAG: bifunctional precorrin-2 dehydrogenase/sirohydrochlorin ferrochelatase [Syntrophobacteraceae bacterium]
MGEPVIKPTRFYPLFLAMEDRTCLVVGGGAVGERKVKTLLKHGANVRLIAHSLSAWLDLKCSEKAVFWAGRQYEKAHLKGVSLVFAATSDMELNRTVAADARDLDIWCNMATDPELGSFIVPSTVERGPLCIAVSTSGLSPAIAKLLRQKIEREIGREWEFFIRLLGELREYFKIRNIMDKESQKLFSELAAVPLPELLQEGAQEKALHKVSEICSPLIPESELQLIWNNVWKLFS